MFTNLEDLEEYYNKLISDEVSDETLILYHKFMRLSPEKLGIVFGLDIRQIMNEYKRNIHTKIICFNKIKELSENPVVKTKTNVFGVVHELDIAICHKYSLIKYGGRKYRFYPTIKYLYCIIEEHYVLYINDIKIHLHKKEFKKTFKTLREWNLDQLLKNN